MSQELFRREVLEARRMSWLGGICLAQPVSMWGADGGRLCRRAGHRVVSGHGQLYPTLHGGWPIGTRAGTLDGARAGGGDRGSAACLRRRARGGRPDAGGDYRAARQHHQCSSAVDLERQAARAAAGLQSLQQGQQRSLSAQATGLAAQLSVAHAELAQIEAQIGTRQQQIRINNETLARLRELHAKQYVSLVQLQQQESAVLDQAVEGAGAAGRTR